MIGAHRIGLLLSAAMLGGCFEFAPDWSEEPTQAPKTSPNHPDISVSVPAWPPIGPNGAVQAQATDRDGDLSRIEYTFLLWGTRSVSGQTATVSVTGPELGEGFGTLSISAIDRTGRKASRDVTGLLVDLTPPKIAIEDTLLKAGDDLQFWVGDAWVLGSVMFEYAGATQTHDFPHAYPATLGKTWDYSLISFSLKDLGSSTGIAKISAKDAAGNQSQQQFTLTIDGDPPEVAIVSPAAGTTLSGDFVTQVTTTDAGGGPVWLELRLGGTPIGSGAGGNATIAGNTAGFVPGPSTLLATAVDRAGNVATTEIAVTVE